MAEMFNANKSLSDEAVKVLLKLLRKGKVKDEFKQADGATISGFCVVDGSESPYKIDGYWYRKNLTCMALPHRNIVGLANPEDQELFEKKVKKYVESPVILAYNRAYSLTNNTLRKEVESYEDYQ